MRSKVLSFAKCHWAVCAFFLFLFVTYLLTTISRNNGRGTVDNNLTDHISHVSMTIAFLKHGHRIFKQPADQIFRVSQMDDAQHLASVLGWSHHELFSDHDHSQREYVLPINWSQLTRPYPPGNYIYHLPEAFLRYFGFTDPVIIAKWTVVKYGLAGLIAALVLAFVVLSEIPASDFGLRTISIAAVCLMGWHLIHISFAGIYDPVAIIFVCLALYSLHRGHPIYAVTAYSCAVFLHFRSLWYIAIPIAAAISLLRAADSRQLIKRHRFAIVFAAIMLLWTATSFEQLYPSLIQWPMNNTQHLQYLLAGQVDYRPFISLAGVLIVMGICRLNLLAICSATALLFAVRIPQVMPWHALFAIPLIAVGSGRTTVSMTLALVFAMHFGRMFFGYDFMFPGPFW